MFAEYELAAERLERLGYKGVATIIRQIAQEKQNLAETEAELVGTLVRMFERNETDLARMLEKSSADTRSM